MSKFSKTLLATLLGLSSLGAYAANTESAVASCYPSIKLSARSPETQLIVLVDQTTQFDASLQQSIATNLASFIKPGQSFSVFQFSAFTQGHYAQKVVEVTLDPLLPANERNAINKVLLTKFDACLKQQISQASSLAAQALQVSFGGTSKDIAKSDILSSVKAISNAIRQSPAKDRVVLIASDMLENSSISSFYAHNTLRKIDPTKELGLAMAAQAIGDFGNARVFVLGAGVLSDPKQSQGYRDPKSLNALADFWREWFKKSNANLVEFGTPALLSPVR